MDIMELSAGEATTPEDMDDDMVYTMAAPNAVTPKSKRPPNLSPFPPGFLTLIRPEMALSTLSARSNSNHSGTPEVKGYKIGGMASIDAVGSYGVVVDATRYVSGTDIAEPYVAKFFGYSQNRPDMSWILREIDNLRHLRDVSGVATIKGTFLDTPDGLISNVIPKCHEGIYPIIVMERCDGGDLCSRIIALRVNGHCFSEAIVSRIFRSFIAALADVHQKNMINCDLKTENLVFKSKDPEDLEVKIIDFGIAVHLWDREVHYEHRPIGTPAFQAPESLTPEHGQYEFSRASDIWQAGCILYIMLTMEFPFGGDDYDGTSNRRNGRQPSTRDRILDVHFIDKLRQLPVSDLAKDLLIKMFRFNPKDRITARQTLRHPFLERTSELSSSDLGQEHKTKTMVKYTRYSLRGLLNNKLHRAGKLLELRDRCLDNFSDPPLSGRKRSYSENGDSGLLSARKRSASDSGDGFCSSFNLSKVTKVEVDRIHKLEFLYSNSPISLSQFQKIRSFIISEFKKTLGIALCPKEPVFISKLFEFPGIEYSKFRAFLLSDREFSNLGFLCDDEALKVLDGNQNGKVTYFEFMIGLGPLVAYNGLRRSIFECDGVALRRSSSCGDMDPPSNNLELSLDSEIYYEIFNIYQNGIIYPLVIIHGLSYMLQKDVMVETIIKGYNLSEQGLTREEFIIFFRVVLENSKSYSALRTC
jgi:serine/threonine protein kinase